MTVFMALRLKNTYNTNVKNKFNFTKKNRKNFELVIACPVKYVYREEIGFRKCTILNKVSVKWPYS